MSDIDDAQIKDEIDGIMNGVKTIMEKIDALIPSEEQGQVEDADGNTNASGNSNTTAS